MLNETSTHRGGGWRWQAPAALLASLALGGTAHAQAGLTTLYSFTGAADGAIQYKGPAIDAAGNLYGNSFYGASACPDSFQFANVGCGALWKLDTSNTLTPLVTFTGATNGADPDGNLTLKGTTIYGTTWGGGASNQGTVFQVKNGGTKFKTLYSFSGLDGEHPDTFPRLDSQGNIFSITQFGGPAYNGNDSTGFGVLFEITSGGQFISQHPFSGGADGGQPGRVFLDASGTVFGATLSGGSCTGTGLPAAGCGTLYKFVPTTGAFTTLYTFGGTTDGYVPQLAGLDAKGDLYGATTDGGAHGYGTLFELKANSSGGYAYKHLYDFTGGADGAYPGTPALKGSEMIGGTQRGPIVGSNQGAGVLFDFNKGTLTTLYTFLNDAHGGYPFGTPVLDKAGVIYGTTAYGGTSNPCNTTANVLISSFGCGTVYKYVR